MTKEIKLTQGKVSLVSDHRYEKLNKFKWHAHKCKGKFYAGRNKKCENGKFVTVRMHAEITGFKETDHKDGDGLNNQDDNLRECTHRQNTFNRLGGKRGLSVYKGVSFYKRDKKWMSRLFIDGNCIYLGLFDEEKDAGIAYNEAAKKYFGEFAMLNQIDG